MANKLLLFDIDGTLLLSRGIPRNAFLKVIKEYFPHISDKKSVRFSGMTDPKIIKGILRANGEYVEISDELLQKMFKSFALELALNLNRDNPPDILQGVIKLLDKLQDIPNCYLGLVTGNIMAGAYIKLSAAGLYHYFAVGAFGCDHEDRNMLPPIAIERAKQYYGVKFKKDDIWIIGDSIHDVRCAKANGLKSMALPTGFTPEDLLFDENPDYLLQDLNDVEQIVSIMGFE